MLKTRDEIMFKFAADILDLISPPPIPVTEQLKPYEQVESQEEEPDVENVPVIPIPIEQPVPITQPVPQMPVPESEELKKDFDVEHGEQPWLDPNVGSPEWAAKNYPYAYLKGHDPFLGYASDPNNTKLTQELINKIVEEEPEKYFEWEMYRRRPGDNPIWMKRAAENLINTNPETALILHIFAFFHRPGMKELLPKLWEKSINYELGKTSGTDEKNIFPGVLHYRMRALLKKIAEETPEFYDAIKDSPYAERFKKTEVKQRPISTRETPDGRGSLVWLAKHYPKTYLRGNDIWKDKRVRDGRDPRATEIAMNNLIEYNPIKYFEWGLRRPHDLKKWMGKAVTESIKRHPHEVLMFDLYKQGPEIYSMLPDLWNNLIRFEKERIKNIPETYLFQDRIFNKMRRLAGEIARTHPDFYINNIPNIFKTRQFNDWATNALREKHK